ncbi:NADH-quinone oxidoreductase subunit N [Thermodesulfovibrio aggregans]|uniref:NADH-quinone oxidoreductase subunit N n=1 Tax=Thermodesulfovibrio aggregans TaxID=86166 RepID=A0A0U9IAP7_9BACT|nr:NADH-quinone oxidoreductase subunit N [Thermodesulfovibrio aggregans]GAQ95366.1 NADH-quinone oxidoreductase subunit N [Thermodesulfovibrio aggregans]
MDKYLPLMPEIVFTTLFLIYFVFGLFIKNRQTLGIMVIVISLITSLTLFGVNGSAFNDMFVADKFSQSLKLVFLLSLFLCTLISLRYEKIQDRVFYEYSLLLLLSTLAMMLIVSSRDFIPLFLSVEFMSLCIYLLSGFILSDLKSNEASLKYYILGSFASAILLFGISAIYGVTGTTTFDGIAQFFKNSSNISIYHYVGAIGIITALAFKAGCAPFHQWSPDVYEGAPTTITAFMSVAPKAAALGALGRVIFETFSLKPQLWLSPLILIALLTMATGNILALRQNNLKRLLAYSSIAHAGYVMLAVIACSQEGLDSIVFYMFIYTFMNIGAFAVVLILPEGEKIDRYVGLSNTNIFVALSMLVFMFSLAGIPPLGGFIAKFLVFKSIIHAGYVWVALVGIIFSILSAYYYLRVVVKMFFASSLEQSQPLHRVPANLKFAIGINTFLVITLGIFPDILRFLFIY